MAGKPATGRPRIRPPAELSMGAWRALIMMARFQVVQLPPPAPRRAVRISHGIDVRNVAPLLTEGYARTIGVRPRMRYRPTREGWRLIHDHPHLIPEDLR